jgi:adenylyltransferase/sulfurtransferase
MSGLGERKVESARRRLLENNPDCSIDTYPERLTEDNAATIIALYEVVLDGSDNLETRRLINKICIRQGKPMVYGSAVRFEGQVGVFDARSGSCYQCAFPQASSAAVPSPAQAGVLGPLPGIIGSMEALETLKILLGAGEPLLGRLLIFDGLRMDFQEIRIPKNPRCPDCS